MPPFADIDTPVSEDELSGSAQGDQTNGEKTPVVQADAVVDDDKKTVDGEKTANADTEAQPTATETKTEREPVIPRARFDELNSKLHLERQETERLRAELEASKNPKPSAAEVETVDVKALEKEYFDAVIDGDQDKAVAIREKINDQIYARAEAATTEKVTRQLSERDLQTSLSKAVDSTIAAYPFLDSTSPDANQDAIAEVVDWRDFYLSRGDSPAVALQKAAAKVGPTFATAAATITAGSGEKPEVKTDLRKQKAVERNITDATAQAPAPVAGIGNRTTPPAPKIDTQKDWEKLSESEREAILANA
jgi:hypothetical protein